MRDGSTTIQFLQFVVILGATIWAATQVIGAF